MRPDPDKKAVGSRPSGGRFVTRRAWLAAGLAVPAATAAALTARGGESSVGGVTVREEHPMKIRRALERGHADHGWLRTFHTFSFADYYDPENMGFRTLRVINEDWVAPAKGFGTHPHRDMEIVTYVLEGELQHKDSMGNGSIIRPGEVQRMTAGTGVTHSEFNASQEQVVHLLQIWILPERRGLTPGYEQRSFDFDAHRGSMLLIASGDGRDGSVTIHQDARVYAGRFGQGQGTRLVVPDGRHAWLHVARGAVNLGRETLGAGDAASWAGAAELELRATGASEVLLFELG